MVLCAGAAVALAAAVLAAHPWPRDGADQIRHMIDWGNCVKITVDPTYKAWPHAKQDVTIECHNFGTMVRYAKFDGPNALKADVLATPPHCPGEGALIAFLPLKLVRRAARPRTRR